MARRGKGREEEKEGEGKWRGQTEREGRRKRGKAKGVGGKGKEGSGLPHLSECVGTPVAKSPAHPHNVYMVHTICTNYKTTQ